MDYSLKQRTPDDIENSGIYLLKIYVDRIGVLKTNLVSIECNTGLLLFLLSMASCKFVHYEFSQK